MTTFDSDNKHADIDLSNGDLTAEIPSAYKVPWFGLSGNTAGVTVNFGGSSFTHSVPSGFSAYGSGVTLDSSNKGANITLSGGNLTAVTNTTSWQSVSATTTLNSGKKYIEVTIDVCDNSSTYTMLGIGSVTDSVNWYPGQTTYAYGCYSNNGNKYTGGSSSSYGSSYSATDIISIAIDYDNEKIYWGKNGTWFNSGLPASKTGWAYAGFQATSWRSVMTTDFLPTDSKRYFEIEIDNISADDSIILGARPITHNTTWYIGQSSGYGYFSDNGYKYHYGSGASYGNSYTDGDVIMVALDQVNDKIWFGKNGTWQASGDPAAGTNAAYTGVTQTSMCAAVSFYTRAKTTLVLEAPFNYTVPTGFEGYIQPASSRITHALAEVLRDGDPKARITHAAAEILRDGKPKTRITHAVAEILRTKLIPDVRITHAAREILRDGDPMLRITHAAREVMRDGDPMLRITHVSREVLRGLEPTWSKNFSSMFLVFPQFEVTTGV